MKDVPQCRDDGEGQCGKDHDGRVDTCKAGDERLALRLMLAGILHQTDDLRDGALAIGFGDTHPEDTREIDTPRDHLIADINATRQRLARQRHSIQGTRPLNDHAVQGNLLARLDDDDGVHGDGGGREVFCLDFFEE